MPDINWLQVSITAAVSIVSGGMMGALFTNHMARKRSRVQPVNYSIGTDIKAGIVGTNNDYTLKVSVKHGELTYEYPRLVAVKIEIANAGISDFSDFPFGFKLTNGDRVILCEVQYPDRHNPIKVVTVPTPISPLETIDFACRPFNREKLYEITLYVEPGNGATTCSEIQPSSSISVNFVRTGSAVVLSKEQVEFVVFDFYRRFPFGESVFRILKNYVDRKSKR